MRFFILRIYFFFLKLEEIVPEKSVLQKISRKGRFRYIDGRDDIYNVHSIRHEIHHKKVLRKTFREESYLDKQVDRLTDAEWLASPGLSASTTQTLYPRHSWSVSLPLPVSQFPPLFLLYFRVILLRLPSSSPLPKIPRSSHLSSRNSFVSGAWRDL